MSKSPKPLHQTNLQPATRSHTNHLTRKLLFDRLFILFQNFDLSKRGRSGSPLLAESDDPSETDENDAFIEDDQIINGTKFVFETTSTFEESR